jgi:hypothetical protein
MQLGYKAARGVPVGSPASFGIEDMSVHDDIIEVFARVAHDHGKRLRPLADDMLLLESGMDSLCLAIIITSLEVKFGIDPFTMSDDVEIPVTFGEFVSIYAKALNAVH